MEPITLLVAALATARLTRLVTRDRITHALRRRILKRLDPEGLLAYLLICDWCSSVYMGAIVTAGWLWGPAWLYWVAVALALSHITGWLASHEREDG